VPSSGTGLTPVLLQPCRRRGDRANGRRESAGEQRAGANRRAPTRSPSTQAAASMLGHRSSIPLSLPARRCLLPAWAWMSLLKRSARVGGWASHRCQQTSAHPLAERSSCCIEAQPPKQQPLSLPVRRYFAGLGLDEFAQKVGASRRVGIASVPTDERPPARRAFELLHRSSATNATMLNVSTQRCLRSR